MITVSVLYAHIYAQSLQALSIHFLLIIYSLFTLIIHSFVYLFVVYSAFLVQDFPGMPYSGSCCGEAVRRAAACALIPSPLPVKPRCSSVVALTLTFVTSIRSALAIFVLIWSI